MRAPWSLPPLTARGLTKSEPTFGTVFLDVLRSAIDDGRQLKLDYQTSDTELTICIVQPLGLVTKSSVWYLVAQTDEGRRTFQVSRVQSVDVQNRLSVRRTGFDLGDAWRSIGKAKDSRAERRNITADAVAERWTISLIRNLTAIHLIEFDEVDAGHIRVEVSAPSIPVLAHGLAGFGPAVDVSGPPELVRALGRLGHHLADRYGSQPSQP